MDKKQDILEKIWSELKDSLIISGHPFHIFSLSTINNNFPDSRNVVLRSINKDKSYITFHTDKRSNKIIQIKDNNNVCCLFYDKTNKIQLKIYGKISIVEDKQIIFDTWSKSKDMSKVCYLNKFSPGTPMKDSKEYILERDNISLNEGIKNFCILKINISIIDWLNLNHKGHERLLIDIINNKKEWIAP